MKKLIASAIVAATMSTSVLGSGIRPFSGEWYRSTSIDEITDEKTEIAATVDTSLDRIFSLSYTCGGAIKPTVAINTNKYQTEGEYYTVLMRQDKRRAVEFRFVSAAGVLWPTSAEDQEQILQMIKEGDKMAIRVEYDREDVTASVSLDGSKDAIDDAQNACRR